MNATQATPKPTMAAIMARMIANMKAMRLCIVENKENGKTSYRGYHSPRPYRRGKYHGYFNGRGIGRRRNAGRINRCTMYRGNKYCHMHGNYARTSRDCETIDVSHKEVATHTNIMGGSTHNCE